MRCDRWGMHVLSAHRTPVRGARGFTLIELLVTVVVLAIATALVIPQMGQTGVLRVQSAVRTITSDIALAQTEAMAYQTRRAIYFGVVRSAGDGLAFEAGNGYAVVEPTTEELSADNLSAYMLFMPENNGEPYARNFATSQAYGGAVIENASFDGGSALMFDELGGPIASLETGATGNGGTVVVSAEAYGVAYEIGVEAMTGRITVTRIEGEGVEVAEAGE